MPVDLSKITKGPITAALRVLIYAADGLGKTTFAAGAPDAFILDANKGSHTLNVRRIMPETWDETLEWLAAIEEGKIKCETVVIDSITDLEMMLHSQIFQNTTIDEYKGGYKRGDTLALTFWRNFVMQLERIWLRGKNIVLVAHMQVRHFEDPMGPGFDRHEVSCRPQVAGLLRQWCSYVLFAREDVSLQPITKGSDRVRASTSNIRKIYTRRSPAYDAKARGTTLFPESLPLSWEEFEKAIKADAQRAIELRKEIDEMLAELGDPAATKAMNDWIGNKVERLVEGRTRVAAKLAEKRKAEPPAQQQQPAQQQGQPAANA